MHFLQIFIFLTMDSVFTKVVLWAVIRFLEVRHVIFVVKDGFGINLQVCVKVVPLAHTILILVHRSAFHAHLVASQQGKGLSIVRGLIVMAIIKFTLEQGLRLLTLVTIARLAVRRTTWFLVRQRAMVLFGRLEIIPLLRAIASMAAVLS